MHALILSLALLAGPDAHNPPVVEWAAFTPPPGPLCRVAATYKPSWLGRVVTVVLRPGCPADGYARIRFASSLGGTLPDSPPGYFTLDRQHPAISRHVPYSWWVESLSASGLAFTVPEAPAPR